MAQKSKKTANRWKGDVKDPSEPIDYEVDKILWWQEKITELTLRGVTDVAYKAFALLPPQNKQSALGELEKVIQNQIERMSVSERDKYVRELEQLENDKWYEIYVVRQFANICWIGTETWGCSFGHYAIIHRHTQQQAPKSLKEMKFKHTNDFEEFMNIHPNLSLFVNIAEAPYSDCMDFCLIRKLGNDAQVKCFTYKHYSSEMEVQIGSTFLPCKRY